jgi:diguanylate cyclase (GGDEF)-like protein
MLSPKLFQFSLRLKHLDSVQRLRVWVTFGSLLLGAAACMISWGLVRSVPNPALSDVYGLPVIALGFVVAALLLFLRFERLEAVQIFACVVAGGFLLLDFRFSGLAALKNEAMLGVGVLWFPILIVIVHLSLASRPALYFSLAYNLIAICISAITFSDGQIGALGINALIQFHVVNLVMTGFIAVFGRMRQHYHAVEQQAHTDVLTGIQNRRFMQRHLEQVHTSTQPYGLLILDVDFFKQLNDHYGHAFGDVVLRELAFTLENHTRQGDHLARWGGEEFLILTKNSSLEQAQAFAERLRKAILEANPGGVRVTVSIGVALRHAEDNLDDVLARADTALYRAKNDGRDQVHAMVAP